MAMWAGIRKKKQIVAHFSSLFLGIEAIVSFSGLLETFFNEAAVLWFVFPLLDAVYEARKDRTIRIADALKIIGVTWAVALLFFYFATYFKKLATDGEKRVAQINKGKGQH
jgi:hypothetical protein